MAKYNYDLEKQHAKGKLHAIERINALCDKDSFNEIYSGARHTCTSFGMDKKEIPYDGVITGFGKINGKKVRPEYRIQENDELSIATFLVSSLENQEKNAESVKKENQNSFFAFSSENTVFKNDDILVINKPYDTNVQGKDSLAEQIAVLWKSSQSLSFMPGPLHRLDRKTTGLLVFSQSLKGARWFSSAIAEHKIEKTYIALLEGSLPEKCLWKDKIVNEQEIIEKSNTGKA